MFGSFAKELILIKSAGLKHIAGGAVLGGAGSALMGGSAMTGALGGAALGAGVRKGGPANYSWKTPLALGVGGTAAHLGKKSIENQMAYDQAVGDHYTRQVNNLRGVTPGRWL